MSDFSQDVSHDTGKLDARVLNLILSGQLRESSAVADPGETAQPLADHPRLSKVLRISRMTRSVDLLRDLAWIRKREPTWTVSLDTTPLAKPLFDLAAARGTGFLVIDRRSHQKTLAISAGVPSSIYSNADEDHLEALLRADGVDADALGALRRAAGAEKPLAWALLYSGKWEPDAVCELLERQATAAMFALFGWQGATARFYEDARAAQIDTLLRVPLLAMFRTGVWGALPLDEARLRHGLAPILAQDAPLLLLQTLGALQFEILPAEGVVLEAAREGMRPSGLLSRLAGAGQESLMVGLKFWLLAHHLGVVGVEMRGEAQPKLQAIATLASAPVPPPGSVAMPAPPPKGATGAQQLSEYRRRQYLEEEARALFSQHRYGEAAAMFARLRETQERPVVALAYFAVSTLLANATHAQQRAHKAATEALAIDDHNPLAHAAMARVLEAMDKKTVAASHRKRATELAEGKDTWSVDLMGLLSAQRRMPTQREKKISSRGPSHLELVLPILLAVTLFVTANHLNWGQFENTYAAGDRFFYFRRLLLLGAGLLGVQLVTGVPWREFGAKVFGRFGVGWVVLAAMWGGLVGYLSPRQSVAGSLAVVIAMTALHVVAEEVFFRAYLTRYLRRLAGDTIVTVALSALCFALYHLTYQSFWIGMGFGAKLYWCSAIGLFAGVPLAFLYLKSGGIWAPLMSHLAINGTMMALSVLR